MAGSSERAKALFLARLAEQAERYDEMAEHLKELSSCSPVELSAEERRLLAVAHENSLASRRGACSRLAGAERLARSGGDEGRAAMARAYRARLEDELGEMCLEASEVIEARLAREGRGESRAFYHKMKAENLRQLASLRSTEEKEEVLEEARKAYGEAAKEAEASLAPTHPLSYGLALSQSIFQSQHLADAGTACKVAPKPLRRAAEAAEPQALSLPLVSQRLCDLLLQFPSAASGGVPWSALVRAYREAYGEELDLAALGYSCPSAAGRALLAGVLAWPGGSLQDGGSGYKGEPVFRIADEAALTPLLGYAASWPSLYGALCMLVSSCGTGGLLLSRMRPLLESLEGTGCPGPAAELPTSVRETLLAHLRPLTLGNQKAARGGGKASGDAAWAFLDERGARRDLQKLGQLVQAMLRWRYQRLQKAGASGPVEEALAPRLELVFEKQFNNLVLQLAPEQEGSLPDECPAYYREFQPNRHAEPAAERAPCAEGAQRRRSGSEPPHRFYMLEVALPPCDVPPEPESSRGKEGGDCLAHADMLSQLRTQPSPARSPRSARGRSRGRSMNKSSARASSETGGENSLPEAAEERCKSEPPQAADVAVLDDPFEPPPQELWASACRPAAAPVPTLLRGAGMPLQGVLLESVSKEAVPFQGLFVWPSSCWARAPEVCPHDAETTCGARTRSLSRSQAPQEAQTHPATPVTNGAERRAPSEGRSRSEPPSQRLAEVFDDPFEPPPQTLWASAVCAAGRSRPGRPGSPFA